MSGECRATPELWDRLQQLIDEGLGDLTDSLVLDLRSRVEALEKVIRVITGSLTPAEQAELGVVSVKGLQADLRSIAFEAMKAAQEATQHAHLDASQLSEAELDAQPGKVEAWRYQHLIQAREVVTDRPEPALLATDGDLCDMFDEGGPTVVDSFRAIYDLGRQHGARAAAAEADNATAATVAQPAPAAQPEPPTFQESQARKAHYEAELARRKCEAMRQPAPAVKDSLTTAPAGSLVERVMVLLGHHGDGTARAAIREVADWFRWPRDSPETAAALEHEASR
jgi:hypothetical protein